MVENPPRQSLERRREFFGAAAELFKARDEEILCESGAGTGKSFALMCYADWCCRTHPRIRVLFCRKTRKSMTETVLVDFEEEVLWDGHPAIRGSATRAHRDKYSYPNGAEIILGGLDSVDRIMSSQYDLVCLFEATEAILEDWEKLLTRVRNGKLPWQQLVADCNPQGQSHWLNQRANRGLTRRLRFRHEDNPRWYNHETGEWTEEGAAYLGRLNRLTGARKERLLNHRWVAEEGLMYPQYDSVLHTIEPGDVPKLRWHFASMDFGFTAPGCLQVWGMDADQRIYRAVEVYRSGRTIDWWAEIAAELAAEFNLRAIVCDSSRPDDIKVLNDRLGPMRGRDAPPIAVRADKAREVGFEQVRAALTPDGLGKPMLHLVNGATRYGFEVDSYGDRAMVACTEDEIESYIMERTMDGRVTELPDKRCDDHGLDALRYAVMYAWGRDLSSQDVVSKRPPGAIGTLLGYDAVMLRSEGRWLVDEEDLLDLARTGQALD